MNKEGILYKAGVALGLVPEERNMQHESVFGPARAPHFTDYRQVSPKDSMGLVSVYRAVSIITTATKQLPLKVWRNGVEIASPSLIKQPSLQTNRAVFIEQTVTSLALHGNAYWRVHRPSPTENITELEVLHPELVTIELNDAGRVKEYRYQNKSLKPWQVKHLALLRIPGSPYGLGPVQSARESLMGARDLRNYSTNWFREGATPSGILKTEHTLTSEQAAVYKERFEETQKDGRGVAVLGQGTTYQPILLTPADAQFLESQQFTRSEIALLFGIPASFMLAEGGNSQTYQNVNSVNNAFLKYTLTQYIGEIEHAFTDLLPRGQDARFVVEGFLRATREERFIGHQMAITSGFLTLDEVRAIEGYAPLTEEELETFKELKSIRRKKENA